MEPRIKIRGLHKTFEGNHVLRGVDLDIYEGESIVILVQSGCGKSVLLKHIIGVMRPDQGEIWFDGANGGDGYYGGANEVRHIDRKTYYDWDSTFRLVYSLQPDIIIFSDAGPGCRWIGNERGIAGETNWSTIKADSLTIGGSDQAYLNTSSRSWFTSS